MIISRLAKANKQIHVGCAVNHRKHTTVHELRLKKFLYVNSFINASRVLNIKGSWMKKTYNGKQKRFSLDTTALPKAEHY